MAEESPPDTVFPACDRPPSGRVPSVQPSTSAYLHLGAPVSPPPPYQVGVFSVSRRPRPGARYLFDTFDMTSSMAVEIQLDGIDTHGGRYGNFSSDLAPTTKAPRRSRGSKVGRYQADYRKFERLPWLAKIRVGGPRRLPPPRPRKRSDRQRRTKRQRRAASQPDGAADRCGTLEKRPPPKAA